jgi:hypothetical protein
MSEDDSELFLYTLAFSYRPERPGFARFRQPYVPFYRDLCSKECLKKCVAEL